MSTPVPTPLNLRLEVRPRQPQQVSSHQLALAKIAAESSLIEAGLTVPQCYQALRLLAAAANTSARPSELKAARKVRQALDAAAALANRVLAGRGVGENAIELVLVAFEDPAP